MHIDGLNGWHKAGSRCLGANKVQTGRLGRLKAYTQATKEGSSTLGLSPLGIVTRDLQYLHDHAGDDLINTLAPVKEVHDQVQSNHIYVP